MDTMLLGETVVATGAKTFYGYWMQAGGNDGVAAAEVFYNSVADAFTVLLETKSSDEPDSAATNLGSGVLVTAAGGTPTTYQMLVSNAKDLVRYKLVSSKDGIIHIQYAQPLWQPN